MTNPLLGRLDLDDVLGKFKVYERYHAVTLMLLTVALMFEYSWYTNHVIVAEKIGYRCIKYISGSNLTETLNISIQNTTATECRYSEYCLEWVYDKSDSFVAEFQLACQEWKRTSIGSAHAFGYMLGLILIGPLSDRFGRKTLVIFTMVAGGTIGCAKSFATSYWIYLAFEFLEAVIGDAISSAYTLAIEMVSTKSRVTYTTVCMVGCGVGGLFYALAAWLVPYWRTLLRVTYGPGLLAISYIYLLDESPRWLLANGKKDAAVKIITNAAKLNKMDTDNFNRISYEEDKAPTIVTVIKDTFKSALLTKRFFICCTWWIAGIYVNFGLVVNSTLLKGNKYLNYGPLSGMKFFGNIVTGPILKKFDRKGPLILCFVVCGILCSAQPFLTKSLLWVQIANFMLGLLVSCVCLSAIYIFTSELFPTHSRNSMHALCSAVGRIGAVSASQTPLLMAYWSGLPTLTFGVVSLTAGLVTLLVPDTADKSLPDTVCQAEEMEVRSMAHWSGRPTLTFGAMFLTAVFVTLFGPDTVCQAEKIDIKNPNVKYKQ